MGLLATEIALAGIVLVAIAAVVFVFGRRRLIAHDSDVVTCGFRASSGARWRPALLRMSPSTLQLYPLFGWTVRPAHTWRRRSFDLLSTTPIEDDAQLSEVVDHSGRRALRVAAGGVTESGSSMTFDLALSRASYTTLRYWVESSPPNAWPV